MVLYRSTQSLTHSLTPLTHSITHSLTHSLTHSFADWKFSSFLGAELDSLNNLRVNKEQDPSQLSEVDQLVDLLWRKLQQTNGTPSIHSLTRSIPLTHPLNHSPTHSITHPPTPPTQSLTHSVADWQFSSFSRAELDSLKNIRVNKEQDTSEISEVDQLVNLLWRKLQQTNGTPLIHSLTHALTHSITR